DSNASARYWLKSKLQSFGYTDITFQYFLATREWMNVFNEPAWNVICVKEGTEFPDEYIIIGAHYDSYSSNDYDYPAPGADDNASGVSAVLELARIFKDIDFRRTLIFVGFGAEEQGLWGAHHMADEMYENEANIELMVNYDIISYEANGIYEVNISTVRQKGYGQVFVDAASRLETDLIPIKGNYPSWDDDPFFEYGFQTSAFFEYEFHPDMHTAWDLSSTIDFEYMRQIITMAAAGLPIIDAAPEPIQFELADVGNGEALRVSWDSCFANWSYQIIYGNSENELIDTIDVPPLTCQYDIYGLSEGVRYYAGVIGQPDVGPGPIGYYVNSNRPCIVPLAPNNFIAIPENDGVSLNWESNTEVDLSHYKIIRKVTGELGWSLLIDNVTDSFYTDLSAEKYKNNFYIIFAVDNDFNESDSSELAVAIPASLDAGILFVDETQDVDGFPTEAQQTTFYSAILDTFSFSSYKIDEGDYLTRSTAGQYNPLFWVDDDLVHKELPGSLDTLAWYLDFETNLLLAGWSTIYSMTGQTYFYPGDFFYDQFGITYIAENSNLDFAGATGLNGWPDLEINTALVPLGRMSNIDRFAVNNKAEVILTFNSSTGNPA
ncbi:MAG: M20/M25/M40 family metallo-hydrolase, partial [Candidatus Zixiibacteriota bacterium]